MSEPLTGLFICKVCKEFNEIPDYVPEDADKDPRIGHLALNHVRRHPSVEDRNIVEWAQLGSVPSKHWDDNATRKQIMKSILDNTGQTGFQEDFYSTVDTFRGDAMACWKRHGRPAYKSNTQPKCQDFLSASKEIKPDTGAERKVAGLPSYDQTKVKRVFLCSYCPYAQTVKDELNGNSQ